jgi:hypothetical protein
MAFTWLTKAWVRSDEGFEFQFTGLLTAVYREADRSIDIYVLGSGHGDVTMYEGSLDNALSDIANPFERKAERQRLLTNIRAAVEFQGLLLHVVAGPEPGLHSIQ